MRDIIQNINRLGYGENMGRSLIKQPNGLYAQWSSVIEDIIVANLTKEEMIQFAIDEAVRDARESMEKRIYKLDGGRNEWRIWEDLPVKIKNKILKEYKNDNKKGKQNE